MTIQNQHPASAAKYGVLADAILGFHLQVIGCKYPTDLCDTIPFFTYLVPLVVFVRIPLSTTSLQILLSTL